MGVSLIVITKEDIKTMLLGYACRTDVPKSPLAESTGCIARVLEHAADGHFIRTQTTGPANGRMTGMLASYERTTRGSADVGTSQKLSEANPFRCDLVDIRRLQYGVPHDR